MVLDLSKFNNQIGLGVSTPQVSAPESEVYKEVAKVGGGLEQSFLGLWEQSVNIERQNNVSKAYEEAKNKMLNYHAEKSKFILENGNLGEPDPENPRVLKDTGESYENHISKYNDDLVDSYVKEMPDSATKRMFHNYINPKSSEIKFKAFTDKASAIQTYANNSYSTKLEQLRTKIKMNTNSDIVSLMDETEDTLRNYEAPVIAASGPVASLAIIKKGRAEAADMIAENINDRFEANLQSPVEPSLFYQLPLGIQDEEKFTKYMILKKPELAESEEYKSFLKQSYMELKNSKPFGKISLVNDMTADSYSKRLDEFLAIKWKKEVEKPKISNQMVQDFINYGKAKNPSKAQNQAAFNNLIAYNKLDLSKPDDAYKAARWVIEQKKITLEHKMNIDFAKNGYSNIQAMSNNLSDNEIAKLLADFGIDASKVPMLSTLGSKSVAGLKTTAENTRKKYVDMSSKDINNVIKYDDVIQKNKEVFNVFLGTKNPTRQQIQVASNSLNNILKAQSEYSIRHNKPMHELKPLDIDTLNVLKNKLESDPEGVEGFRKTIQSLGPSNASRVIEQMVSSNLLSAEQTSLLTNSLIGMDDNKKAKATKDLADYYGKVNRNIYGKDALAKARGYDSRKTDETINSVHTKANNFLNNFINLANKTNAPVTQKQMMIHRESLVNLTTKYLIDDPNISKEEAFSKAADVLFGGRLDLIDTKYVKTISSLTTSGLGTQSSEDVRDNIKRNSEQYVQALVDSVVSGDIKLDLSALPEKARKALSNPITFKDSVSSVLRDTFLTSDSHTGEATKLILKAGGINKNILVIDPVTKKSVPLEVDLVDDLTQNYSDESLKDKTKSILKKYFHKR